MVSKAPVFAAIDVGTNSFHLIIASVNNRGMLQIILREKEMVRLGSGSGDMKYIQKDAMERGVRALQNFAELARSKNAEIRAVATSAVREALNRDEFLNMVKEQTGIEIEVVSGTEEGRLIYIGAIHALPIYNQKVFILDIGGGSTETIIGQDGEIRYVHSEKIGSIRLTNRFGLDSDITNEQIKECRDYIKGCWTPILKRIYSIGFESVVCTSGTILNIAAMSLTMNKEVVPDILNGLTVTKARMLEVIDRILEAKNLSARQNLPGMDPKRADIIVAGSLILEQALIQLNIEKILISSFALREGIVFDTIQKKEALQKFHHLSRLRFETIYSICQEYKVNLTHSEHVKDISLKLFDDLQSLHRLGYAERELLEAAALLHDIGYHISHDQHHKHSYYIISHCIMPGFTNPESEVIANIARYHRKSHPKKKHENFESLPDSKKQIVRVLAGILRIAEGIDRRQMQVIKDVKAEVTENEINIYLFPVEKEQNPDIELWGANRRKLLLQETYNLPVNIFLADKKQ
jgi:exopolyphosphatase/guanosine-5'-triphosphate,3'-diphosphate pyrophosphatase